MAGDGSRSGDIETEGAMSLHEPVTRAIDALLKSWLLDPDIREELEDTPEDGYLIGCIAADVALSMSPQPTPGNPRKWTITLYADDDEEDRLWG